MAELSFTKSFLAALDSRPNKLPANHIYDPRSFSPRYPVILPKLSDPPHPPMPKKVRSTAAPGSSKSIKIHLKSARNPILDVKLDKVALSTATIQELKEEIQRRIRPTNATDSNERVPLDKIKLLRKRKPVQVSLVADALMDDTEALSGGAYAEFGVMILGGAAVVPEDELRSTSTPTATGGSREDVIANQDGGERLEGSKLDTSSSPSVNALQNPSFWDDLEGYMHGKINDKSEAARLRSLFKEAWESSS